MSSLLGAWVCGIERRLMRRRGIFVAELVLSGGGMSQRRAGGVGGEA